MNRSRSISLSFGQSDAERVKIIRLCFIYMAGLIGAELTTSGSSSWGLAFHFIILSGLLVNSALVGGHPSHRLFLVMSLAPLMRIISLAMPLPEFSDIYRQLIVAVPLLVGIFGAVKVMNLRPRDIGLTIGEIPIHILVAIIGIGFGLVDYWHGQVKTDTELSSDDPLFKIIRADVSQI